jgi:hypothetical protein
VLVCNGLCNGRQSHRIAFATDPSTAPVDSTPHYQVYPTDTGLRITAIHGHIDLPWRWITPIGNALNA